MNIQIVSDLHCEFHADKGKRLLADLDSTGVDVLVVAGDLGTIKVVPDALKALCDKYPRVVYVIGNHELYQSSPAAVEKVLEKLNGELKNLDWLDRGILEIGGITFAGTPLWFKDDPLNVVYKRQMNDFTLIKDFVPWVYEENRKGIAFLEEVAHDVDVVVTHYLPSMRSVAPEYQNSTLNRFFVCEMDHLIYRAQPQLWVHGHTHTQCDYTMGKTRVVCNPLGYPHEANEDFDDHLTISLDTQAKPS